jgi:hypothetical protein
MLLLLLLLLLLPLQCSCTHPQAKRMKVCDRDN